MNDITQEVLFILDPSQMRLSLVALMCNYHHYHSFVSSSVVSVKLNSSSLLIRPAEADSLLPLNYTCLQPVSTEPTPVRETQKHPARLASRCLLRLC